MTNKTAMLAALSLLLACATAQAQRAGGPVSFDTLDENSDGKVTLEEFKANFTPGGRNGRTPNHERLFGRWDADGDGELTAEEFENRPRRQQRN